MYTQCPECETTFKLSAEDLRRAKGKVRCGDCHTVFNALEYLEEEVTDTTPDLSNRWTDSTANPPGDLDPDFELDEEEESGAILYIGRDDDIATNMAAAAAEPATADSTHRESGSVTATPDLPEAEQDDADLDAEREAALDDAELEAYGDADPETEDDFDDSVWERIPGVGTDAADTDDWQPEDTDDDEYADAALTPTVELDDDDTAIAAENTLERPDEDDTELADNATGQARPVIYVPGDDTLPDNNGDDLEFNVPEDKWNNFFGPLPKGQAAAVWQPPALDANDAPDDEEPLDDELNAAAEPDEDNPSWRDTHTDKPKSRAALWVLGGVLAVAVLATQLIHYNRDTLAASAAYGEQLRALYASLGMDLYPAWPIDAYEIRGSEAVAGETGPDILDIRAQIAATGNAPVGLPRLRVVLRDRWSNPVAAQDFGPREYAPNLNLPADGLLQPGVVISAHVSIQDPEAGAQGFELELCLPRRHTGLECSGQPFK